MTQTAERAGHKRLLDRLGDDFAQLRTLIDAEDDGEWRATPFPFYDGEAIEPVNMFTRSRRPGKQTGEEEVRVFDDAFAPCRYDPFALNFTLLGDLIFFCVLEGRLNIVTCGLDLLV